MNWSAVVNYLVFIPGILISITVNEYTKALTSACFGDTVPKNEKRLTLNPFKHIEPIGFILMLVFRFGWGKPVRTSAIYYKNRKRDTIITYTMPIIANLVAGFIFFVLYKLILQIYNEPFLAAQYVNYLDFIKIIINIIFFSALYNVSLAIFNIIPVYPLCGGKILSAFLGPNQSVKMAQYEKIFQLLLMILIFFGFIGNIIQPFVDVIFNVFELITLLF